MTSDAGALHRFDDAAAALAERVVAYALSRARHEGEVLREPPSAAELADGLSGAISTGGLGVEAAFSRFLDVIAPACQAPEHPRFLAFVPYAPAVSAELFDMAISAAGIFGTSWLEAAGATAAEDQALRWLADLAGMPAGAGGTFLSGGTVANVNGLAVARHAWRASQGDSGRRVALATSAEVHSSVKLAARVLEIDLVEVPVDERGRLTGDALRATLASTTAEVCAVAATAGITNLGLVDDLAGIAQVCRERGLWLHVDGAYGGAALASSLVRHLFDGVEQADSLVIDPHKWLFTPLDCSALIYRDPGLARAAFTQSAAYLDAMQATGEHNPGDLAAHLTRRVRGLPFWFLLAAHGTDAVTAAVEHSLYLARDAARLIDETPYLELRVEPELSVVVFRRLGWEAADYQAWSARMLRDGEALVMPTMWHGETLMRFCFVSPRTTVDDVRFVLDSMA